MHNSLYLIHFAITLLAIGGVIWFSRQSAWSLFFPAEGRIPFTTIGALTLGGGLFLAFGLILSSPPVWIWDFINAYYPAGKAMIHNDRAALQTLIGQGATGGFVNIPVVAYLFAPFGLLPPKIAAVLFTVIGVALTIFAWRLLVRLAKLDQRDAVLLAILFLANGPLLTAIKFGNLSYFVLAALAAALLYVRDGRTVIAAAILGVATVIKPALILMGLFFLFRRDIKGIVTFAAVGVGTALLSLLLFGWTDNYTWFEDCIVQYSQNWLPTFSVQSISGFILRFDPTAKIDEWVLQTPTALQNDLAKLVTGCMFLAAAAACVRRGQTTLSHEEHAHRLDLQYILVACLCLVTSPLVWSHYYAWMLLPTAFFLSAISRRELPIAARWVGGVAIALITPLNGWPAAVSNPILSWFYRTVFMSHMFFGGLLLFGLVAWWLSRRGGLLSAKGTALVGHPKPMGRD